VIEGSASVPAVLAARPLLSAQGVTKTFGGVTALRDVSFEVFPGEIHALVGENGAGKSTLIRILTGAHAPSAGVLLLDGQAAEGHTPGRARARGIAAIYQQPALLPDLSVAENIAFGLEPGSPFHRISWKERRTRARHLLARVGAAIDPDATVSSLSMPEQQLVEIARALGAEARVLIMDEPTSSLSHRDALHLLGVVRELRAAGAGIVYITHRLEELFGFADRVTALRDGRHVATRPMHEVDRDGLIRLMVGRPLDAVFPKRTVPLGDTVLSLRGLSCADEGVQDVTFDVRAGEIFGLSGLVGAGRTALARTLFGLAHRSAGEIRLHDAAVRIDTPAAAIAHGIAYVPEDRRRHGVIPELSVAANIGLASLRGLRLDTRAESARARVLAESLAVKAPSLETPVAHLSGGNQQKVALARWLFTSPRVLILDEPTQGIDVGAKAEIHRLMCDLAERGLAVILISSEMPEVLGMCDRIGVMRAGRLQTVLPRAAATQEILLAHALGEAA
jgi:rhamnose transport system ATP-binding protein